MVILFLQALLREAAPKRIPKAFGHCPFSDCTPPRTQTGTLGHFISEKMKEILPKKVASNHPGKGLDPPPKRAMPKCLRPHFRWGFPKWYLPVIHISLYYCSLINFNLNDRCLSLSIVSGWWWEFLRRSRDFTSGLTFFVFFISQVSKIPI